MYFFSSETHEYIIDQQEIKLPLIKAHEEVLAFIKQNTRVAGKIHDGVREDSTVSSQSGA